MRLYKYCKQEHNPFHGCKTLQLGTTLYFKNNFDEKGLVFDDTESRAYVKENGAKYSDGRWAPNAYIFSAVTKNLSQDEVLRAFPDSGYDSCYSIKDADAFHKDLTNVVGSHLRTFPPVLGDWVSSEKLFNEVPNTETLIIAGRKGVVQYKKGEETGVPGPYGLEEFIFFTNFFKWPKYIDQSEYRFLYMCVKNALYWHVAESPILVSAQALFHHFEKCNIE